MIRFRAGHSWKRERSALPKDSFSLQVDGMDLLGAATEESLTSLIPELISAVSNLTVRGKVLDQVSLPEAHLELAFQRRGTEAEIRVVDLGRPARLLHRPVRVDLGELRDAAVGCGKGLIRDLDEASLEVRNSRGIRQMQRALFKLKQGLLAPARTEYQQTGYSYRASAPGQYQFGFELYDENDLLLCPEGASSLASLLFTGSIHLQLPGGKSEPWHASSGLFLLMLELSRQGADLCHAFELEEDRFEFAPGGVLPLLRIDLVKRLLQVDGRSYPLDPQAFARGIFELGVAIAFAISAHNQAQSRNPYLMGMLSRCREGLSQLRAGTVAPTAKGSEALEPNRGRTSARPLQIPGRLRRLRYAKSWEKHKLEPGESGRLIWSRAGPIFASSEMVCGWARDGQLLFRRLATHGAATSPEGCVVSAGADRLTGFVDQHKGARWIRSYDGTSLAPELLRRNGLFICVADSRIVLALSELTGREVWRVVPSRTREVHVTLQGSRVLLATESGTLLGADLDDGQVRYRLRVSLPFVGPAVAWGRRFAAVVGRGEQHAIVSANANSAAGDWMQELALAQPSSPLPRRNRVWVAGIRESNAVVCCLGAKGKLLIDRSLPLGPGPFHLLGVRDGVLITSRSGAAALFGPEGQVIWKLEPAGEELARAVAPCFSRGVLVVPGEQVRVVDPVSGDVLAKLRAGVELCDLKVDAKLGLYLLDEDGSLSAHKLLSHFAVVSGQRPQRN